MGAIGRGIAAVWLWLKTHNESVVALATSIQAIAVAFAVYQIALTKTQIEDARRGVQANVELQIQHDGRDLLNSLSAETLGYIYNNQPPKLDTERDAQRKVVQLLNYYASIFRQHDIGGVDEGFWDTTKKEFCFFVTRDHVKPIWDAAVNSNNYVPAFVEVGKQCIASATSSSPRPRP